MYATAFSTRGHIARSSCIVLRVAIRLVDQKQELARTVVLGHRIGAARDRRSTASCRSRIDKARTSAGTPSRPLRARAAAASRRSSRRRGSTNARRSASPVAAQAVAIDQHVRQRRSQRVDQRCASRGTSISTRFELLAPLRGDLRVRSRASPARIAGCSGRSSDRSRGCPGRELHVVERARPDANPVVASATVNDVLTGGSVRDRATIRTAARHRTARR